MDASKMNEARGSLAKLSKDLTCPIWSCIEQALRHTQRCPSCNGKAKRRDVREDGTVDTIVRAFQGVEAEIESFWRISFHAMEQSASQKRLSKGGGEPITDRSQRSLPHKDLTSKDNHKGVDGPCPGSDEPSQIKGSASTNDPGDDPVASPASRPGAGRTQAGSRRRPTKSKTLSPIAQYRGKRAQPIQPSEGRRRGSARLATWTCKSCTLINKPHARECEVCLAPRNF